MVALRGTSRSIAIVALRSIAIARPTLARSSIRAPRARVPEMRRGDAEGAEDLLDASRSAATIARRSDSWNTLSRKYAARSSRTIATHVPTDPLCPLRLCVAFPGGASRRAVVCDAIDAVVEKTGPSHDPSLPENAPQRRGGHRGPVRARFDRPRRPRAGAWAVHDAERRPRVRWPIDTRMAAPCEPCTGTAAAFCPIS